MSTAKKPSTIPVTAIARTTIAVLLSVSARRRYPATPMSRKTTSETAGGVRRARRREQCHDRHDREACVPEGRPCSLGDRGLAVADHLGDRERAEDADRDQHVCDGGDPDREERCPWNVPLRVLQVTPR